MSDKAFTVVVQSSGLYYKHIMIVNYNSSVVNKLGASLPIDARVVIYDWHMFIVQATEQAKVFAIVSHFHLSLIFVGKVRPSC
jgi:hypothetical protein